MGNLPRQPIHFAVGHSDFEAGYMANATERGEQLRQGLLRLKREHPEVGDVRGIGTMNLVADADETHAPALRQRSLGEVRKLFAREAGGDLGELPSLMAR